MFFLHHGPSLGIWEEKDAMAGEVEGIMGGRFSLPLKLGGLQALLCPWHHLASVSGPQLWPS